MEIICKNCNTSHYLSDDKIPLETKTGKCKQCSAPITVLGKNATVSIEPTPPEQEATKNCDFCGEIILAIAKKCRHCGSILDGSNVSESHGGAEQNIPPSTENHTAASNWFYEKNGQQQGSVTETELIALIKSGSISYGTLVWRKGFPDWINIENTELRTHLEDVAPPLHTKNIWQWINPMVNYCSEKIRLLQGATNSTELFLSYDQVPWYRKNWFAIVCGLFFVPAIIPSALTGNFYYQKQNRVIEYPKFARIFLILWSVSVTVVFVTQIFVKDEVQAITQFRNTDEQENAEAQNDTLNFGFTQDTPSCADDKVKAWMVEKMIALYKKGVHSENTQEVLQKYLLSIDLPYQPQVVKTPDSIEFTNFFEKFRNIEMEFDLDNLRTVILRQKDGSVGYDILKKYQDEKIVAQALQEIDKADASASESLIISLSAIRTKSKNDSIKKIFCIANIDRANNGEQDTIKNIEYTAQVTEDGLLYMELLDK